MLLAEDSQKKNAKNLSLYFLAAAFYMERYLQLMNSFKNKFLILTSLLGFKTSSTFTASALNVLFIDSTSYSEPLLFSSTLKTIA